MLFAVHYFVFRRSCFKIKGRQGLFENVDGLDIVAGAGFAVRVNKCICRRN